MKTETLITRYKNLGYVPIGGDRDQEVCGIVKWIYETYGYFCCVHYSMHTNQYNKGKRFYGLHISSVDTDWSNSVMTGKYFDNPYDAAFDSVRDLYRHLKFMGHIIIDAKKKRV